MRMLGKPTIRPVVTPLVLATALLVLTLPAGGSATLGPDADVALYLAGEEAPGDAATVERGIDDGELEPADEVVLGETLVAVIDSPRLAATMANGSGSTTARFLDALAGPATFRVVQTNPTPDANRKVAAIGERNVTVYRDGDRAYVLVDTAELSFRYRVVNRSTEIYGDERFTVEFGYDLPELPLGGHYEAAGPVVTLHPFESRLHRTGYWYAPLSPEWVAVAVNVEVRPEEALVVRVRTDADRSIATPVRAEDPPTVTSVWLDLRDLDIGTSYALELVHDGEVVDRTTGTVLAPEAELRNVSVVDRNGGAAVAVNATLSHGGKVQVLDGDCNRLGTAWVGPNGSRDLTIELWGPDGERLQSAPDSGVVVRSLRDRGASRARYRGPRATASLGFDGRCTLPHTPSTPRPTATPRTPSTGTPTAPPTTAVDAPLTTAPPSPTTVTRTGTPGQPGFTAIAAVAALVAVAAWRRP